MLVVMAGVTLVGACALAVRLAVRPLPVTVLVRHFAAHPGGMRLRLARATVFWDREASPTVLVLALHDAVLTRSDGSVAAQAHQAAISVLAGRFLLGGMRPVAVSAATASLALLRSTDGSIGLDSGKPHGSAARSRVFWRYLRSVNLRDISVAVTDRIVGTVWRGVIHRATAETRGREVHSGAADVTVQYGRQTCRINASLSSTPTDHTLIAAWSAFDPSRLGSAVFAPAALANLPIGGRLSVRFSPDWRMQFVDATIDLGVGHIVAAGGMVPIAGGSATLHADLLARHAWLTDAALTLGGRDGAMPIIHATGGLSWAATGATGRLSLDASGISFADLPRYWPPALGHDARAWFAANVTAGRVTAGHLDLGLAIDHGTVTLTDATGRAEASDITLSWLRPVPGVTRANATLTLLSPDALAITVPAATQTPSEPNDPPLLLQNLILHVTGLSSRVQLGVLDGDLSGSIAQGIALLGEKRLNLLSRHPITFGVPSGQAALHLHVRMPLDARDTIDDVAISATGTLSSLHLGGVLGGRDLDDGQLSLAASNDGLTLKGTAELGGIPSTLAVGMDFRAGPPDQTVSSYTAHGSASFAQLKAAGLADGGLVNGTVSYDGTVFEHRDGTGDVTARVDLREAGLVLATLGWRKAPQTDTIASAILQLDHDRVVSVDRLSITGPGIDIQGHADYDAGQPVSLSLDPIVLGQTRAAGEIRFPTSPDAKLVIRLHGSTLDLSGRFQGANGGSLGRSTPSQTEAATAARQRRIAADRAPAPRGRPWTARLRFDQVLLGVGQTVTNVTAHADNDGQIIRRAEVSGEAGHGQFGITLTPQADGRVLHGTAQDAGGLLQALNITTAVHGGALTIDGIYDDTTPNHTLTGKLKAEDFRVVGATAVARLLQAMTFYGLVDVLRGPGLGISHLVAPFKYSDSVLTLQRARAYSSSLGFTSAGDIDLIAQRADLTGTIVPGYFFNTLLGKLPVVGKIFSPEKGGGVFAATYRLDGPLGKPVVSVNPLSALTPGFLRGLFDGLGGVLPASGDR